MEAIVVRQDLFREASLQHTSVQKTAAGAPVLLTPVRWGDTSFSFKPSNLNTKSNLAKTA